MGDGFDFVEGLLSSSSYQLQSLTGLEWFLLCVIIVGFLYATLVNSFCRKVTSGIVDKKDLPAINEIVKNLNQKEEKIKK